MPNPLLDYTFPKRILIRIKKNVRERLEFQLVYNNVAVQHVRHNALLGDFLQETFSLYQEKKNANTRLQI